MAVIVIATPNNNGNVFIREGPSRLSPTIGIPAYNFARYGCLYEVDEEKSAASDEWYYLRGLGWSMRKYFTVYVNNGSWLVGLNREQVEECITYLQNVLAGEGSVD